MAELPTNVNFEAMKADALIRSLIFTPRAAFGKSLTSRQVASRA
jgi:hypothetical protein